MSLLIYLRLPMAMVLGFLFVGCAHRPHTNWNARLGTFTFDQAVEELGPPDKSAQLTDGTIVGDWLTFRGESRVSSSMFYPHQRYGFYQTHYEPRPPDQFLRLTFDPQRKLKAWKRFLK